MMLRDIKRNLQTREITETEAWEVLDWVLECCHRHGITEVTLVYGYDWDVGDRCWAEQSVKVAGVREHIRAEEERERGCLGYDDVYITVDGAARVYFCHHSEVHLGFDQDDLPLVKDLSTLLIERIGLKQ